MRCCATASSDSDNSTELISRNTHHHHQPPPDTQHPFPSCTRDRRARHRQRPTYAARDAMESTQRTGRNQDGAGVGHGPSIGSEQSGVSRKSSRRLVGNSDSWASIALHFLRDLRIRVGKPASPVPDGRLAVGAVDLLSEKRTAPSATRRSRGPPATRSTSRFFTTSRSRQQA